jgi:hypothetical protein
LNQALTIEKDDKAMRERKCIVSGEVREAAHLIRFVVSPDGEVVPDVAAKLPGRGIWISADRKSIDHAVAKNLFSKAAKANVKAPADLAARVEKQLTQRLLNDLGLARRSGALVLGFDNIARAMDEKVPPPVLVEASDGSKDGRRKLYAVAHARGLKPVEVDCFSGDELSLALGKENVIHAALKSGALAEKVIFEAGRLSGFRSGNKADAGSSPAHEGLA